VVGVAEGVVDVAVAVGLPAVVDGHAGHLPDHPEGVHRHPPPLRVALEEGEECRRGGVHPVEARDRPGTGLVDVHRGGFAEERTGRLEERPCRLGCFGDHGRERPGRDRSEQHAGEQLSHALEREVLVDTAVGGEHPDARPVAGGGRRDRRERRLRHRPARTAPLLRPVLGGEQADLGQVEDLSGLDGDHRGIIEPGPARVTRLGHVGDQQAGIGHLGEVLAGSAGLLALLPRRSATLGPGGSERLREQLCRGGHRGVPGIATGALLHVGDPALQLGNLRRLCSHERGQLLIGRDLEGGIAGRNSSRYARRSRGWWTRRSGDLNSYG
jgi:hypothetical protein